jgi:hypothetical protein
MLFPRRIKELDILTTVLLSFALLGIIAIIWIARTEESVEKKEIIEKGERHNRELFSKYEKLNVEEILFNKEIEAGKELIN